MKNWNNLFDSQKSTKEGKKILKKIIFSYLILLWNIWKKSKINKINKKIIYL